MSWALALLAVVYMAILIYNLYKRGRRIRVVVGEPRLVEVERRGELESLLEDHAKLNRQSE